MGGIKTILFIVLFLCGSSWASSIASQDESIDLLIRTKQDQILYMDAHRGGVLLPAKSLISVTIQKNSIPELFSQPNLSTKSLLPALKKDMLAPYIHKVVILESHARQLESQDALLNIVQMIESNAAKFEGYEYSGVDPMVGFLNKILSAEEAQRPSCFLCRNSSSNQFEDPYDQTLLGLFLARAKNYVQTYEESPAVQKLIAVAKKNISFVNKKGVWTVDRRPHNKCVRSVKMALKQMYFFVNDEGEPYYPSSRNAVQLAKDLTAHGFTNLLETPYKDQIKNPYDAPTGTILIYVGGPGHSEIRTEDGFVSDYFSEQARTGEPEKGMRGNQRELKGVYMNLRALHMS